MGREQHILLAILGLLAGTFVGVLSMKLLSPRPPDGASERMQGSEMTGESEGLSSPTASYSESAVRIGGTKTSEDVSSLVSPAPPDRYSGTQSQALSDFAGDVSNGSASTVDVLDGAMAPPVRDPFQNATHDSAPPAIKEPKRLDTDMVVLADPIASPQMSRSVAGRAAENHLHEAQSGAARLQQTDIATTTTYSDVVQGPPGSARAADGTYVTVAGDSWWSLAERLYGDGRVYRALFAWNRSLNPRVSLVPGTRLEVPAQSKLSAAWPHLLPVE